MTVPFDPASDASMDPAVDPAQTRLFDGLTDAQRTAVMHLDGPLLVLAGPGSGKTTVVTRRIAYLVSQGIPAWQILALTFTNKAAGEMRERVDGLLPPDVPGRRGLTVATFHAFCARILRRYADAAGIAPQFTIYDTADQRAALKQAIKSADLSDRNFTPASMGSAISSAKNALMDAPAYAAQASDFYDRCISRVFTAYENILRSNDALDFDDLLLRTARLLRTNMEALGELQERYQYLLIDEYQDTNHAQFQIASALASSHRNICVVGDPDQSIYGWRGADIRNILDFEEQYDEASVVPLGQNFRSTAHIVGAADALIRHNINRKANPLYTELEDGEQPTVVITRGERTEAQLIVDEFRRRREEHDVPWKEMAVLYRINALSRVIEEAFRDAQVPYVVARGTAFYERKEIKDALSYLRLVANPSDEVALRRIINTPTRGIGKTTLDCIERYAIHHDIRFFDALRQAGRNQELKPRAVSAVEKFVAMIESWRSFAAGDADNLLPGDTVAPLAALVERIVRESGMEALYRKSRAEDDLERLENLNELINAAAEFTPSFDDDVASPPDDAETGGGESGENAAAMGDENAEEEPDESMPLELTILDMLNAWLESVTLVSDADAIDPANGAVTLMTLHAAKGLEFDVVAIAGLDEGLLPHARAAESDHELEEERRLCFVGMTRARRHLMLTRAAYRTQRGLRERMIASRFLDELPTEHVTTSDQAAFDAWDDDDDALDLDPRSRSGRNRRGGAGGPGGRDDSQDEFPRGCFVQHPTFGLGRVESVVRRPVGSSARITFQGIGTKTLILEYAKLKRVDEDEIMWSS